jgi:hypothetical protein
MDMLPRAENFIDVVASALMCAAVLYSVVALFGLVRATRIGAILLVASLALYSDSFGTYFAAIFIVATAVTELEFLEKLAAIIRGSKEYFDYKKSQVPVDEAKAKAAEEMVAAEVPNALQATATADAAPGHLLPSGDAASLGYTIEQLTLTYFERRLGNPIQRNVRFSTARAEVEFDGIVEKGAGRSDTLLEVKLASVRTLEATSLRAAREFMQRKEIFKEMTGRRTTGILVIVVPDKSGIGDKIASLKSRVQSMSHTLQFEVVDFKDIGYSSD